MVEYLKTYESGLVNVLNEELALTLRLQNYIRNHRITEIFTHGKIVIQYFRLAYMAMEFIVATRINRHKRKLYTGSFLCYCLAK